MDGHSRGRTVAGAGCGGLGQFLSVDEDWFGRYPAVLYYCIKIWYRVLFAVSLLFFKKFKKTTKRVMMKGAVLGLFLFGLFAFLMHGLQTTSASNGGFLTSTTVVLVPIFMR